MKVFIITAIVNSFMQLKNLQLVSSSSELLSEMPLCLIRFCIEQGYLVLLIKMLNLGKDLILKLLERSAGISIVVYKAANS